MIVKCQYTGLAFEAKSSRSKNHPVIAEMLNQANKGGTYSATVSALNKAREQGFATIEQFVDYANAIISGKLAKRAKAEQLAREQEAEIRQRQAEAKTRRQEQNAFLRQRGYAWSKEYADYDEYEEGEPSRWVLRSPDDRAVDVAQALDEIERGADVVLAEKAAERQAEQERQERRAQVDRAENMISNYICHFGDRPKLDHYPAGETLFDTFNIYGSGHMFIIEPDGAVWFVLNNGMDGDDWSRSNLPGSIGYRLAVPEDEAEQNEFGNGNATIASHLRQLAAGEPLTAEQLKAFDLAGQPSIMTVTDFFGD